MKTFQQNDTSQILDDEVIFTFAHLRGHAHEEAVDVQRFLLPVDRDGFQYNVLFRV